MKVSLELDEAAVGVLVPALLEAAKGEGLLVAREGRTRPFSVAELVDETGLSETQVRREIEAGRLVRVPGIGRVLVTVESVRRFQAGEVAR